MEINTRETYLTQFLMEKAFYILLKGNLLANSIMANSTAKFNLLTEMEEVHGENIIKEEKNFDFVS